VRAATHRASLELMRHYARWCLQDTECTDNGETVAELIDMLLRLSA